MDIVSLIMLTDCIIEYLYSLFPVIPFLFYKI